MIRCIIAGGRDFHDYAFAKHKLDAIFARQEVVEIVSGGAPGADALGERYAAERGWPVKRFPADWSMGRKAGPLRNGQMATYATLWWRCRAGLRPGVLVRPRLQVLDLLLCLRELLLQRLNLKRLLAKLHLQTAFNRIN